MMMAMTTASATATRGDFRVPECLGQKQSVWWEAEVVEATWIGRSREEVKRGEPRLKEGRKVVKMRNSRLCGHTVSRELASLLGQGCQTPQV